MGRLSGAPKGNFYLREPRGTNKDIDGTIYIRYFVCGKYIEHSTDIRIPCIHWKKNEQQVSSQNRNWKRLNAQLEAIKANYDNKIMAYDGRITPMFVKNILNGEFVPHDELPLKTDFVKYALDYNQQRYNQGKISYSTYDNGRLYILAFKRFLKQKYKKTELSLADLTLDIFNKYIEWRVVERGNTNEGINKTLTPLYKAIKYACDNELVSTKVGASIWNNYLDTKNRRYKSDVDDKPKHYLTPDQMKLFNNLYSQVKYDRTREIMDMYMFAFYACGLRISDVITLEWKHINFDKKTISKNCFKTKTYSIDIPLTDAAIEILNRWKEYGRNERFVFDLLPKNFNLNDQRKLNTARMSKNRTIQESLKSVGEKMKLSFNLTFHSARHSFAVMSIKQGVDIHLISKLLGHKSIQVTEQVYAEFMPKDISKEVRDKLAFDFSPHINDSMINVK